MRAALKCSLIGVALVLAPAAASAQDAPKSYPECTHQPTEGDVAGAKGAFQAGQASFEEGDYPRAISYWEDAYRRDCTAHALLLNLARAYELHNQKKYAVHALETYLARNPASPQRDQIARRIEGLNEKIAQENQARAASGEHGQPSGEPPKGGVEPVTPDKPSRGKRPITPLIVAGAGGVVTIVGGLLYLGAAKDVKDFEDKCGGRVCPDPKDAEAANSARSRQNLWGPVTIVGVAAAVGGTIWYFASTPRPAQANKRGEPVRSASAQVEPIAGRGLAGLAVTGSF